MDPMLHETEEERLARAFEEPKQPRDLNRKQMRIANARIRTIKKKMAKLRRESASVREMLNASASGE